MPSPATKSASEPDRPITKNDVVDTPDGGPGSVPACVSFEDEMDNADSEVLPLESQTTGYPADPTRPSPYAGILTPETRLDTAHEPGNISESTQLPAYIEPLSNRIPSEDLEFLQRKGALNLPELDLQIEILRAYLFSVHPFMPMLDYRRVLHSVLNEGDGGRISLLLFQAVMFAGLHSLQHPTIHRLGFRSPKEARAVFFNRVRLLYEFDVEPEIAAVLQSLILMSSWYSKWDGRRDTWHWTGLAYDVARRMGLHRETLTLRTSSHAQRFRKRLWWSLYIRDRMIALGTRRPMRIHDQDFDVSMLSLEDFDLQPFEELYQGSSLVPNTQELRLTALMCIQLANLCKTIGRVVKSQYTLTRSQANQDIPHTVMIVSRRDGKSAEDLEKCDRELNYWFEALPKSVERKIPLADLSSSNSCSDVHWSMLVLTYQTTLNVLHRAQALQPGSDTEHSRTVQAQSRSKVKESARSLTKLSQNMLRHDHVRYLGLIGVTALIAAYLSHMLDVNSPNEDIRDAATFRLHQTLEVLHALRQIYASADAAVTFLASVSRKAGIAPPASVAESTPAAGTNTAISTGSKHQVTTWKGTTNRQNGDLHTELSQAYTISNVAGAPVESPQLRHGSEYQIPTPSGSAHSQPNTNVTALFNPAQSTTAQDWATCGAQLRAYNSPQFIDTTFGSLSNLATDGSIFDWDGGIDFGMDIAPLSFNYDFYSDSLGIADS